MIKKTLRLIISNIWYKLQNIIINVNPYELNCKIYINQILDRLRNQNPSNYILDGFKVYSQNDEDGIIESIFRDIGIKNKIFVEIGVGDGLENNTHYLVLKDWRGIWIDSNKKHINKLNSNLPTNNKLLINCNKITTENINSVIKNSLVTLDKKIKEEIDFLSIDIDSNDIFCLEKLDCVKARVICIEYNAKFPPSIDISVNPNEFSRSSNVNDWEFDDYMGASLSLISKKLETNGYKLISTNITGSNAFFVLSEDYKKCKTFNLTIKDLYMPPNYYLFRYYNGHRPSLKFLKNKLKNK